MTTIDYRANFEPRFVDDAAFDTLMGAGLGSYTPTTLFRNGRVRFANVTGGAVSVEANLVPEAGSVSDSNKILPAVAIGANSYIDVDIPFMKFGTTLQAKAGAANSIAASLLNGFHQY